MGGFLGYQKMAVGELTSIPEATMTWRTEQRNGFDDFGLRVSHQQLPLACCSDQSVAIDETLTGPNLPGRRKGKHHLLVGGHLHHATRIVVPGRVVIPVEAEQDVSVWQGADITGHLSRIFPDHLALGTIPNDLLRPFCRIQQGRKLGGLFSGHHGLSQPCSEGKNQKWRWFHARAPDCDLLFCRQESAFSAGVTGLLIWPQRS